MFVPFSFAQSSTCVTTKVGAPVGTPPEPPAECLVDGGGSGGNYRFPLESASVVTAVSTEMASYGGGYSYKGHVEHAGLDIGVPYEKRVPVYATTNGSIIKSEGTEFDCRQQTDGCTVKLQHATDKLISVYTHINPIVTKGQSVFRGAKLGYVHDWPNTSRMDHLHFELREQATDYNINPRNYFPELQRFPASSSYSIGGSVNVRAYAASRGIVLDPDGRPWAEKFQFHPPCPTNKSQCWAK